MARMTDEVMISLSITAENEADAARAVETLSRAAVGLAFEGMFASMSVSRLEEDDDAA